MTFAQDFGGVGKSGLAKDDPGSGFPGQGVPAIAHIRNRISVISQLLALPPRRNQRRAEGTAFMSAGRKKREPGTTSAFPWCGGSVSAAMSAVQFNCNKPSIVEPVMGASL